MNPASEFGDLRRTYMQTMQVCINSAPLTLLLIARMKGHAFVLFNIRLSKNDIPKCDSVNYGDSPLFGN